MREETVEYLAHRRIKPRLAVLRDASLHARATAYRYSLVESAVVH